MIVFLVIAVVLLALVFGISSIAQSVATAKQAEATIEVAKATQMATAANTAVIIVAMIVVLAILFLIVYVIVNRVTMHQRHMPSRRPAHFEGSGTVRYARALRKNKPEPQTSVDQQYYEWLTHADPAELNEFEKDLLEYLEQDR